jgi:GNAT superfamily N-acetyltransferase
LAVEPCFQSFDEEIAKLPGTYAPPGGKLLLANVVGQPVGCIGLRPFPVEATCEMKRLYVRPPFRGDKIGRKLAERLLEEARAAGYKAMRLDSHPPTMGSAIKMYRNLGFQPVSPEPLKPIDGLVYMELQLR